MIQDSGRLATDDVKFVEDLKDAIEAVSPNLIKEEHPLDKNVQNVEELEMDHLSNDALNESGNCVSTEAFDQVKEMQI